MPILKKKHAMLMRNSLFFYMLLLIFLLNPFKSYGDNSSFSSGRLHNGLTYYIHHDPHSKKHILLDFIIKVGSLDEQEDEKGFSHLIEHSILDKMQFKDKSISDSQCEIWDFTRPNIGAVTSYNFTQYHFEISIAIPQGLEEGLLGFSKTLSQFFLDEQELQDAKDTVLHEIVNSRLSPIESWKHERIVQEYPPYQNKHPFGSQESILRANLEKVSDFYKKYYQAHYLAVIIVGNVDLEETKHLVEKYFGGISAVTEKKTTTYHPESSSKETWVYINEGLKGTFISLAKQIPKMSPRDSLAFSILTQMLSLHLRNCAAVPQSTFSQPILETSTYPEILRLTASLTENFEEGIDQLKGSLKSFFNQSITADQLDQIKVQMKNNLQAIRVSGDDPFLSEFYRDHFILNASSLEKDHPYLRISLLDTLHVEDINQMLQSFKGFSHVSVGSFDEKTTLISPDLLSRLLLKNGDQ
jgi:zinc protease